MCIKGGNLCALSMTILCIKVNKEIWFVQGHFEWRKCVMRWCMIDFDQNIWTWLFSYFVFITEDNLYSLVAAICVHRNMSIGFFGSF